jgi:hypothetical protein
LNVKWFSVKTLYRSTAAGLPEKPDLHYDPEATLMEERILFVRAKNLPEAVAKAEREAGDYAQKVSFLNPYNQKVTTRYLGFYEAFELNENPGDKVEIYSSGRLVNSRISDAKVAHVYIGKRSGQVPKGRWKKFTNREYKVEAK